MPETISRRSIIKTAGATVFAAFAHSLTANAQSSKTVIPKSSDKKSSARLMPDLRDFIPELMRHHGVPGLSIAVVKDAKIVWTQGFGVKSVLTKEPVDVNTPFVGASFSKAAFACAVLKLCDKGKLNLDEPLWNYKPNFFLPDEPQSRLVTARMILSHSSGLRGRPSDKIIKFEAKPGEKWMYSPLGYGYLQQIVEHITGQPLEEFMQANLLRPFGMRSSSYDWSDYYERQAAQGHDWEGKRVADRNFYEKFRSFPAEEKAKIRRVQPEDAPPGAAFSLTTTPADYARLLIEIIRPTRADEFRLSEKRIAEMLMPQIKVAPSIGWGLGWEIERGAGGSDAFYHYGNAGNFQNLAVAFKREKSGVVIMTNSGNGLRLCQKLAEQALGAARLPHTFSFS